MEDLEVEIEQLENERDELEAALKKVNDSLTTCRARLRNAREEREQFDEASDQILVHLKAREQLEPFLIRLRGLVGVLRSFQGSEIVPIIKDDETKAINERRNLENEFLDWEAKFLTILSMVEGVKRHYYYGTKGISRKDDERIKDLVDALEKVREEFESIERPFLQVEHPIHISKSPLSSPHGQSPRYKQMSLAKKHTKKTKSSLVNGNQAPALVELEHLESEFEEDDTGYLDELGEWEFDQLEKEVKVIN
ncbi:hypothetical protein JCGZ_09002 [Jatropha curcas]|uniref:Uncharacterized protein n=1 Tax=Jatropha curcas TaxID=180498 RepID=A0A067KUP0_JATCU|nr:hypothetical protein JCGZ_09002 [Jatropha curcas]